MLTAIQKKLKNKKGFTLIELIVVMAILGIIAAIAIPNFTGIQNQSKIKADYATAAQIVKAARLQEVNTGEALAKIGDLDSEYFDESTNPQSGGSFALSKDVDDDEYTITWIPAGDTGEQTYTEGDSDFNID